MGEIVVNMGRYTENVAASIQEGLPDERVVSFPFLAPVNEPEILVTSGNTWVDVKPSILPSIKWVHLTSAGAEGFPFEALGDRVLTCSKGINSVPIAEFVLAAMLAFEKRLSEQWLSEPPPAWDFPRGGALGGLAGATVALIGLGSIGTEVAKRALAFDMTVVGLRRSSAPPPFPGIEMAGSLEEALARADHVVVTAPDTPATHHLIDEESLRWVKRGTHIVNVARGTLVDSDALLAALDDDRVARASLDVAEGEPLPAGHPLYRHPGVHLTPHISHSSHRNPEGMVQRFSDNLDRWRTGRPLEWVLDPAIGY